MTSVAVTIERVAPGVSTPRLLYLRDFMIGPASELLITLAAQFQAGVLTGPWNAAEIHTTVSGRALREILSSLTKETTEDPQAIRYQEGVWPKIVAYREAIEDQATYSIHAIEA